MYCYVLQLKFIKLAYKVDFFNGYCNRLNKKHFARLLYELCFLFLCLLFK